MYTARAIREYGPFGGLVALDPTIDRLLTRAARERGVSRAEFVRQQPFGSPLIKRAPPFRGGPVA